MINGANQATTPDVTPHIFALPPLSKEDGRIVKIGKTIWACLLWIWKWIGIYLHNINVRTIPEKPQNKWTTIVSIVTLGTVLITMYFSIQDRDNKRVKELQTAAEANGARTTMDIVRDQTLANQAKEITTLKQTLGLLPPTPTPPKEKK